MLLMAKIDVTRTELIWPGKYNEDGTLKEEPRVSLPFQVIETVNESRATHEAKQAKGGSLFDTYDGKEGDTFEAGWRNKLIWGDNLLAMGSLLAKFAGRVDLIYIDPPFATGADFAFRTEVGESGEEITKEQSALEEKAYRDTWGSGISSYLDMVRKRLGLMRELLSPNGSIYVHLDATVGHYVKALMDEVFGLDSFQREIIWRIGWISGYKSVAKNWIRNHDMILFYVKTPGAFTFNKKYVPYPPGYERRGGTESGGKGYPIEDVWNANPFEFELKGDESLDSIQIKSFSQEKTGYATQKNESVLRRILEASSNEGDLVADFFCGSGTTLAVAEKLNRRWIGCDLGRWGIHVTRKRLLGIENCRPFEVLNLGKYERQYWQGATFGEAKGKPLAEKALYEYLAFILKLYGAQPVAGMTNLHGKRGKAMIHIGAVDAPVTIGEIDAAVDECAKLKQGELHVLGWEWEMGLQNLIVPEAKTRGVKLLLLQIPREVMEQQARAKNDVRFFELAYLEAEIKQPKKLTVQVSLKDFVIPNTELIPQDVRSKVKKWSDYIDYWAVDWDFRNDTFMQGWVAYRTRKERKLPRSSDAHTYKKSGRYRILVKVIDIFGNDTSQAYDVEVN
jgi:DNA modification methylase